MVHVSVCVSVCLCCKCKDAVSAVNACFVGIDEARAISSHGFAAHAGEDKSNW